MDSIKLRLKHLSQEHQAAQAFAKAMRASATESDADLPGLADRICTVFRTELEPHFAEEERYVLPTLIRIGRPDLAERTQHEHDRIRQLVVALARPSATLFTELSRALEAHVKFEDEELWAVLAAALDAEQPAA